MRSACHRRLARWTATILGIALLAAALMTMHQQEPEPSPPASPSPKPAVPGHEGMELVMESTFDDLGTVDLTAGGRQGHHWYLTRPFGFGRFPRSGLSVADGVLTIDQQDDASTNYGIASVDARTGAGRSYHYGYFEVRLRFDPENYQHSQGWPAFWTIDANAVRGGDGGFNEIDIVEVFNKAGARKPLRAKYAGAVWDHFCESEGQEHCDLNNGGDGHTTPDLGEVDWNEFHTYGLRWTPGELTWYFDGRAVIHQRYSAHSTPEPNPAGALPTGTFSTLDRPEAAQALILGTGRNHPIQVDHVKVWQ